MTELVYIFRGHLAKLNSSSFTESFESTLGYAYSFIDRAIHLQTFHLVLTTLCAVRSYASSLHGTDAKDYSPRSLCKFLGLNDVTAVASEGSPMCSYAFFVLIMHNIEVAGRHTTIHELLHGWQLGQAPHKIGKIRRQGMHLRPLASTQNEVQPSG